MNKTSGAALSKLTKIGAFEAALLSFMKAEYAELMSEINRTGDYNDDISSSFKKALEKFVASQTW